MTIVQAGAINTTALIVPDTYIVIVPPQVLNLNGVPTNILGIVGSAPWGPVGQPMIMGSMSDYARIFGAIMPRQYDMGTAMAAAVLQGASNFRGVRVTDGTDVAATSVGLATCITFTALYTGSLGNSLVASLSAGTKTGTFRLTIGIPGLQPEVFDNIAGTANAFWVALAAAVNNGNSITRGPSNYITAAAGVGVTAPAAQTFAAFTGGLDGITSLTTGVTATVASPFMVGVDTIPRKGMYALRGQGVSIGVLADCTDSGQYTTQVSFGLSEGVYMILTGPSGDTIANALTVKSTAGLDSYAAKIMFGDWVFWNDQANQVTRLISPQGFVAGILANLSPEQSSLNKPMYGVVGTQKSGLQTAQNTTYSTAELQALFQAGYDVITNPGAGGVPIWTARNGHNSSSQANINGDNYTRLTNYVASTLNAGMGAYLGKPIQLTLMQQAKATLLAFLQNMLSQGLLGTLDGSLPYGVVLDLSNNPLSRTSLNYMQADVQIQYMAINEKFLINVEGGQSVVITRQSTTIANTNA